MSDPINPIDLIRELADALGRHEEDAHWLDLGNGFTADDWKPSELLAAARAYLKEHGHGE
jgi:hypothetical protein